jgi:short chain dehydrogenase
MALLKTDICHSIPPKPDLSTTDVDYKAVIYGTQLAIHFMRQNATPGGAIVATASICGVHPIESLPEYSGAKAAVSPLAPFSILKHLIDDFSGHRLRTSNSRNTETSSITPNALPGQTLIIQQRENITINVVCPGCLPTPQIPPFMREFFGEKYFKPSSLPRT